MSQQGGELAGDDVRGLRLTLAIWHPDCWTLEVTDGEPGGLLGHGVYTSDETATGRFTAFGNTKSELEALVDRIDESPLTDSVWRLETRFSGKTTTATPANVTQGLLVEYAAENSINDALVFRGYVPDQPVRMVDGREYWTVLAHKDRDELHEDLEAIQDEMDAVVEVDRIASRRPVQDGGVFRRDPLSERQREVFQLALDRGYYSWPRQTSAAELAEEMGVSKPTLLEHLRKAESRLIRSLF